VSDFEIHTSPIAKRTRISTPSHPS
jgi:hypothetical protein